MKIITNKKYTKIANLLIKGEDEVANLNSQVVILKKELAEAKDLKGLLEKLTDKITLTTRGYAIENGCSSVADLEEMLSDNILKYVDDILGGKVIKQEANKAIVISKTGEVKTGLTKQKTDKGFTYKLVRE